MNVFFERNFEYKLVQSDFLNKVQLSILGAQPFDRWQLSDVEIRSSMWLIVDKLDKVSNNYLDTIGSYFVDDSWSHNTIGYLTDQPGEIIYDIRQSGFTDQYWQYYDRNGVQVDNRIFTDNTEDWGGNRNLGALAIAGNYALPARFENGFNYGIDLYVSCEVVFRGVAVFSTASWGFCDASRSLYWTGLSQIEPISGSIADVGLTSLETGFDFRNASPLLPPTNAVPEPATWAMLLVGFAFVGNAARRARVKAAPARV